MGVKNGANAGAAEYRGLAVGTGATTTASLVSEAGRNYMRVTRPLDDTSTTAWRYLWAANIQAQRFKSGQRLTVLVRARASISVSLQFRFSDGTTQNASTANKSASVTTQWQWLRYYLTMNTDGYASNLGYFAFPAALSVGNWIDIGEMMIVEGDYDGVYCDGNTPGWVWLGEEGRSESAGYPYMLESIAGVPQVNLMNPAPSSTTTYPFSATDHSVYCVQREPLPTPSAAEAFWEMQAVAGRASRMIIQGSSSLTVQAGSFSVDGNSIYNVTSPTFDMSIMRVYGVSLGLTPRSVEWSWNGGATFSGTNPDPGRGPIISLKVGARDGTLNDNLETRQLIAYSKKHDGTTRLKIMQWLANKHGL